MIGFVVVVVVDVVVVVVVVVACSSCKQYPVSSRFWDGNMTAPGLPSSKGGCFTAKTYLLYCRWLSHSFNEDVKNSKWVYIHI